LERERTRIEQMFEGSRPHYLIETIAELPAVVRDINARLARGEMPQGN
ncbi:phosphonoacetaldehyde hydrolase, partial [Pseudomonas aeruginosa]|nr:phosphonoacetaldehyde hydrolase [Pseudomonas aeruginosa]